MGDGCGAPEAPRGPIYCPFAVPPPIRHSSRSGEHPQSASSGPRGTAQVPQGLLETPRCRVASCSGSGRRLAELLLLQGNGQSGSEISEISQEAQTACPGGGVFPRRGLRDPSGMLSRVEVLDLILISGCLGKPTFLSQNQSPLVESSEGRKLPNDDFWILFNLGD